MNVNMIFDIYILMFRFTQIKKNYLMQKMICLRVHRCAISSISQEIMKLIFMTWICQSTQGYRCLRTGPRSDSNNCNIVSVSGLIQPWTVQHETL